MESGLDIPNANTIFIDDSIKPDLDYLKTVADGELEAGDRLWRPGTGKDSAYG